VPCSLLWYDYETTGIDPRRDRPLQVAAIRTDEAFNEIGEPLNLYCQLADDILPHPKACLVTGISPEQLKEQGLPEAEFIQKLHEQMAVPGTCTAGYNNLRFDDELTRHKLTCCVQPMHCARKVLSGQKKTAKSVCVWSLSARPMVYCIAKRTMHCPMSARPLNWQD